MFKGIDWNPACSTEKMYLFCSHVQQEREAAGSWAHEVASIFLERGLSALSCLLSNISLMSMEDTT